jgi:hypothetical protein
LPKFSERVAIAKAIEAAIGKRRGRNNQKNFSEFHGTQTRNIAAERAGFGNPITYQQAKRVVERGVPELVEAMDKGEVSIAAAAVIVEQPRTPQRLYEALHPEARNFSSGKQRQRRSKEPSETVSHGFSADTAAKTGTTVARIRASEQVESQRQRLPLALLPTHPRRPAWRLGPSGCTHRSASGLPRK